MRSKKDWSAFKAFFFSSRNLFLLPIIIMLLSIGVLIVVSQSSAVAPLIYTLF